MSTKEETTSGDDQTPTDPIELVRENETAVESLTDRDDRIGAMARILLALANDDDPSFEDLDAVGIPLGLGGDFVEEGP